MDAVTMTTLTPLAPCWYRALKIKSSCKVCLNSTTFTMIVMLRSFEDQTVFYMAYAKVYKKKNGTQIYSFTVFIKCVTSSASLRFFTVTPRVYSLMTALNPASFYRLAGDPSGLLEGKFCAGCSQLHSLQWRGRIWLQGQ